MIAATDSPIPVRIMVIAGTRPEAIKLAPLIRYLSAQASSSVDLVVASTGQHTDLLETALSDFDLKLTVRAQPIHHEGDLSTLLRGVIANTSDSIRKLVPRLVIVQGDTTSAIGAALAAFNERVPVCHIEAGLRSFHQWEPFPEEMNRRLMSRLASFHFATTSIAKSNLIQEGIEPVRVFPIQNPVHDTLAWTLQALQQSNNLKPEDNMVITVHRREDRQSRLAALQEALSIASEENPELSYRFVWHPSLDPDRKLVEPLEQLPQFQIVPPLPYMEFIQLLATARAVLTDSGGVSEEAAILGVPLVVFRRLTEREDLVQAGSGVPVGVHADGVIEGIRLALEAGGKRHLAVPTAHVGRTIGRALIDLVLPALGEVELGDLR